MISDSFSALKPIFLLLYSLFGIACLTLAIQGNHGRPVHSVSTNGSPIVCSVVSLLIAGIALEIFAVTGSHMLLAAYAIGIAAFTIRHAAWRDPSTIMPGAAAVSLVLLLDWWRIEPNATSPLPLLAFAAITAVLLAGFADRWTQVRRTPAGLIVVFLIAAAVLMADLGGYHQNQAIRSLLAHHWGAFIGPALDLKAGLVPFYDIPLQYGLGPTLLIASACGDADCWRGTDAIVIIVSLVSALLMLRLALTTAVPRGILWQCVVVVAVFAANFLWTGAPVEGNSFLATPSVGGMRFLPTIIVAYLLSSGYPKWATAALAPAVLWAPESAAMACVVFGLSESARIGFVKAASRTFAVLVGSYGGLILLHRAIFGTWIDPAAFAEYVLHVPGPLPINPFSDTLLLVGIFGLGGWLLVRRAPDPISARRDRVAVFLMFAATSYWLGRSHPNNICNLMPFQVLVALRVLDRPGKPSALAHVTELGVAISVAALALSPWHSVPYDPHVTFDMQALAADFGSLEPDIEEIRGGIGSSGGLGIADFGETLTRHPSEIIVWTPMDPGSLWTYVPSARRQLYISRSAARLRRSGWAIFDDEQRFLADDFRAGYVIVQQRSFDGASRPSGNIQEHYTAICFDPRPDVADKIVGPPCPTATRPP
jgi:hypothetical protein